jgi:alanine-glyoxylate transaminase / serine-glyoxylate transaminase / serine-pyruvate transaminase
MTMTIGQAPSSAESISAPPKLNPPERLLFGPGPSNPDPRVLQAMTANPIGHLDPYFVELMDQVMRSLRGVFRTANHHTLPISATGSAGIETIMMNLLEDGDSAVIGVAGYFGHRMAEMARRAGADVRVVEVPSGQTLDPAQIEAELKKKPAKVVGFVHAETTTGACQPIAPMVEVAKRYDALVAMDCVTSLAGLPIDLDALGVDAAGSCSQKCIGAPPGLGPITIGPRAMEAVKARRAKPHTWYLDLALLFQYWGEERASRSRAFHHTAPIAMIYGFHEAVRIILEEGLEARWARHQTAHEALVRGLDKLGISLFPAPADRCATINVVNVPAGVDEAAIRKRLLGMGVEMAGGLGVLAGKVWRIGVMGYNAQIPRVERFLGALEEALRAEGWTPA